jgi:DNA polymerase III epsilon subunit-like protein
MASQLIPFHTPWRDVPVCFVDFETTGTRPGHDRAVQVGLVRFERGEVVARAGSLLTPGFPIPPEATEIHGITNEMVKDAPCIETWFASVGWELLKGAQPAAYNAGFDRHFIPPAALEDYAWPWLDAMVVVQVVDRYAKGKGRHKLTTACSRHGIELADAHSALADAEAAGRLFFKLAPQVFDAPQEGVSYSIGAALEWTRIQEAKRWADFHSWLAKQPPQPNEATP